MTGVCVRAPINELAQLPDAAADRQARIWAQGRRARQIVNIQHILSVDCVGECAGARIVSTWWTAHHSVHFIDASTFRLLLKVAVKGTHQCEFLCFCGGFRPQRLSRCRVVPNCAARPCQLGAGQNEAAAWRHWPATFDKPPREPSYAECKACAKTHPCHSQQRASVIELPKPCAQ